jgi:hypothetical protein
MFPYLISKEQASGGGALPVFEWHIIDNEKPFDVCGVTVTPLPGERKRQNIDTLKKAC